MNKKGILYIAIWIGVFISGFEIGIFWTKRNVAYKKEKGVPKIEIINPVYNFGEVPADTKLTCNFTIKNGGESDLFIYKIRKGCESCTVVKMKKNIIHPKDKEQIQITLLSPKFKTFFKEVVILHTNDPVVPIKMLYLVGEVKPLYEIIPNFINFGILEQKELPHTEKIKIYINNKKRNPKISILKNSRYILLQIKQLENQIYEILLNLKKDFPIGVINEKIKIKITTNNQNFSTEIPMLGKIVDKIYVKPEEIIYWPSDVLKKEKKKLQIFNTNNINEKIKIIEINPHSLTNYFKFNIQRENLNYYISVEPTYKIPSEKVVGYILLEMKNECKEILKMRIPVIIFSGRNGGEL